MIESGIMLVSNQPKTLNVLDLAIGIYEARVVVVDAAASVKFQVIR
jgi:hypothetical protein